MPQCPDTILRLIDRFNQQSDRVRSLDYNETQLRIDFVNPMFAELGWDIDNRQGFAEQYREVVHEDRVKVAGQTKAPDYSFRVGGQRKFFLEAKKPAIDIKGNWEPAYQLRRYAWSAKLACSLLTDFEEFAVYDTRNRPKALEKASTSRREFILYTDYEDRWDFIAGTFSKDAVLRGDFDRYCESKKGRGAQLFDDAFLGEIEEWRKELASNLAMRNDSLDEAALNFAVQRIIDRILFLRIAEDRGTETVGQLQSLLSGDKTYDRLGKLFRDADDRYNSGLFHFEKEKDRDEPPDTLTPKLKVDDKTLKEIIKALYYPQSPYEFTMVSADILGSVYERFLGKVITLTAGHRAKIEEKPEVRKAGGVYYTPTYIVDYIVKNTVGKLLDEFVQSPDRKGAGHAGSADLRSAARTPHLKILDPACGSGSFLIGAYQYLLDWYLDQYTKDDPKALATGKKPVLRPTPTGGWALTIAERKRILLDHIHGVDLDGQAVEVTKLNLLLKCLEGETSATLGFQQRLIHDRALPDLGRNIQCGNSLIGTDIMWTEPWKEMSEEDKRRINPFDYERAFPQVFKGKDGGFDAVIGNPPYVLIQDEFRDDRQLAHLRRHYRSATYKLDTYHLFMERATTLVKFGGRWGFITPSNFMTNNHLESLRRVLLKTGPFEIDAISGGVFEGISVDTAITVQERARATTTHRIRLGNTVTDGKQLTQRASKLAQSNDIEAVEHVLFTGATSQDERKLLARIAAASIELGSISDVNFGKQLRDRKTFTNDVIECTSRSRVPSTHRACFTGRDVERYHVKWGGLACLNDEVARSGGCWDKSRHAGKRKLLTRQIGRYPTFAMDDEGLDCLNTIFMVNVSDPNYSPSYVLGCLNSSTMKFCWLTRFYDQRDTFPKIKGTYLKLLPIPEIGSERPSPQAKRLTFVVDTMLTLHKRLAAEKLPQKREQLQREIDATDRQIDQLVYQLYGLTDDEIRIVEEATK